MDNDSLLITPQLLSTYNADPLSINFLKKHYEEGAFLSQIFRDEFYDLPLEFVHWMYYNLPLTENDKKDYLTYVNIVDTMGFYSSYYIKNSFMIADSLFCENSEYILNSSHINNSSLIYSSEDVSDSTQVVDSRLITSSSYISKSNNIENSQGVLFSEDIYDSSNIGYSSSIYNSGLLVRCDNTFDSFLSRNLESCSNKLLCLDLKDDSEYMILNEKVSERRFKTLVDIFKKQLGDKIYYVNKIKEGNKSEFASWVIPLRTNLPDLLLFNNLFRDNPEVISTIRKNIPDYDKELLYELTLSSKAFGG